MTEQWKAARRYAGLPRFERECRLVRDADGRMRKAYNIPGTREAGQWAMLQRVANDFVRRDQAKP